MFMYIVYDVFYRKMPRSSQSLKHEMSDVHFLPLLFWTQASFKKGAGKFYYNNYALQINCTIS